MEKGIDRFIVEVLEFMEMHYVRKMFQICQTGYLFELLRVA